MSSGPVVWILFFQGCQTNWLIHENSETERQGERGFMQKSVISLESGSLWLIGQRFPWRLPAVVARRAWVGRRRGFCTLD